VVGLVPQFSGFSLKLYPYLRQLIAGPRVFTRADRKAGGG
jgi:hypothetical protein